MLEASRLPEHDAVLALTTESSDTQDLLDLVWQKLVPALGGGEPDAEADARLASRLAGAQLATPGGAAEPDDPDAWVGAAFPVADAGAPQPTSSLREVRLTREGEGWVLVLVDAHGELACPLVGDNWTVSEPDGIPLGVAGGWDERGFHAEVAFLETPHTLRISCRPGEPAQTSWVTEPLGVTDIRVLRRFR